MPKDEVLDCMKINAPEAVEPLSKAFGSMVYIMFLRTYRNNKF